MASYTAKLKANIKFIINNGITLIGAHSSNYRLELLDKLTQEAEEA